MIAEEELESVKLTMSGTCWSVCIDQVIYESDVLVQGVPFWLNHVADDGKDWKVHKCKEKYAKKHGGTCYPNTRELQVSRARLEIQFCRTTVEQDEDKAVLLVRGIPGGSVDDETIKMVWNSTEPPHMIPRFYDEEDGKKEITDRRLVTAFERVPKQVEIVLDVTSGRTSMETICISEVAIGLHSQRHVLNKDKFTLDAKGHPKTFDVHPAPGLKDGRPIHGPRPVDCRDPKLILVDCETSACSCSTASAIGGGAERNLLSKNNKNTVVEETSLCC
mmetsp:Transcript_3624/g.8630  ORF Transcript_3624/g.8630 Transcript_3624/m.8630 type:complete len:276 (-) Transcript_3624:15-842(-)